MPISPSDIKFLILTRTSDRPNFLAKNMRSLDSQTHQNWHQFISNDSPATLPLTLKRTIVPVQRIERKEYNHFPYNLYLNTLNQKAREMTGWIIYLDDDDTLADTDSLARLARVIAKQARETDMVLWSVKYHNGVYRPSAKLVKAQKLKANNQPSNSFTYHTSVLDCYPRLTWPAVKGGDFRFLSQLYRKVSSHHWLNDCFTLVRPDASDEQGRGMRDDI